MKLFATLCAVLLSLRVGGAQARLESVDPEAVSAAARAALSDVTELNQLECSIAWTKPAMAIDLRFHSGFSVAVPLKKLAGQAGAIRTLAPASDPARAVLFTMTTPTPALDSDANGVLELSSSYAVGPGRYAVDLLLTFGDQACREHWQIEAKLDRAFSAVQLSIAADTAAELPPDPFNELGRIISRATQSTSRCS